MFAWSGGDLDPNEREPHLHHTIRNLIKERVDIMSPLK